MNDVYLVKFYGTPTLSEEVVYEEYLFSSYEKALEAVMQIAESESGRSTKEYADFEEFSYWKISITEKYIDCPDIEAYTWEAETVWYFDITGKLIRKIDGDQTIALPACRTGDNARLNRGDFISIVPFPWNPYGEKIPVTCVVDGFDETFKHFIGYTVCKKSHKVVHIHFCREHVTKVSEKEVSPELYLLSDILQKRISLDEETIFRLLSGELLLICETSLLSCDNLKRK